MGLQRSDESMRVHVRTYQRDDHAVVCDLFSNGNLSTYCHDGANAYMRDFVTRSLQRDLADIETAYLNVGGHFWVATIEDGANEQVVGCLGIHVGDDKRTKLRRLSVHTGFRRQGIAQMLVERAELWSRETGFDAVSLGTFGDMVPAIKLYDAMGYTHTKAEPWTQYPGVVVEFFEKKL